MKQGRHILIGVVLRGEVRLMAAIIAIAIALPCIACDSRAGSRCVGEECLPGVPCASNADCDDGLVCNGAELCGSISRRCVEGIPLDCDDGVECTIDRCTEPAGACESAPDDARCGSNERCAGIEGTGCIRECGGGVACDPVAACGCLASEGCTFAPSGAPECHPAGALEHGQECVSRTDCEAGAQCVARDGRASLPAFYAECRALCESDADCPGEGQCDVPVAGTTTRACARGCDLVQQTGCASGTACHPVDHSTGDPYADCIVQGDLPEGAPCGSGASACRAGLLCVTQESGGGLCDRFCTTNAHCTGGLSCRMLVEPIVVDGVEYGVCN